MTRLLVIAKLQITRRRSTRVRNAKSFEEENVFQDFLDSILTNDFDMTFAFEL